MDAAMALRQLKEEALRSGRGGPGFVFGEGSPTARLMIVGEAPGREEERQGRPFVGRAGELLNRLLEEAGIRREEVWITNVVKRHPTKLVDDQPVTRPPTVAEIKADLPWLEQERAIIRPRVVLCLGTVPASVLIHKDFRLWAEHGRWFDLSSGVRALATFHPAYVLRQRGADRDRLLQIARQDFASVKGALQDLEEKDAGQMR